MTYYIGPQGRAPRCRRGEHPRLADAAERGHRRWDRNPQTPTPEI